MDSALARSNNRIYDKCPTFRLKQRELVRAAILQDWLEKQGREKEEVQAIAYGFKKAIGKGSLSQIAFTDFARQYQWLVKTLKAMALSQNDTDLMGAL